MKSVRDTCRVPRGGSLRHPETLDNNSSYWSRATDRVHRGGAFMMTHPECSPSYNELPYCSTLILFAANQLLAGAG